MLNQQDRDSLLDITNQPNFYAVKKLCQERIDELTDIEKIDETLPVPVDVQALGRKYAKRIVTQMLSDFDTYKQSLKPKDSTYE